MEIVLGRNEQERVRKDEVRAHQGREHQRHQPDCDGRQRILDGDDLVILRPDVLSDERLRMVQFFVFMIDGNRRHHSPPEPGTRGVSARASRTSSPALAAASSALIWAKGDCPPRQSAYDFRVATPTCPPMEGWPKPHH